MRKYLIIGLVLLLILISGCIEFKNKECPEDSCEIGSIKCEYLLGSKVSDSKVDDDYVEFNCVKDNNCGGWKTDSKNCTFNDLKIGDLIINPSFPTNETNLSLVIDYSIYSSEDSIMSNIIISFYVNGTDMDGNTINEVIERRNISLDLKPLPSYYNREGMVYRYVDLGKGYIRIPYKINKPGTYVFYVILEGKDKIIEVNKDNNVNYNILYINFTESLDIFEIYNKYKNEGVIDKNIFNKLKKIIYCDTSLSCGLSENYKILFENDIDKILNYFVPNNSLFFQSSTELYTLIKNQNLINLTHCDYDTQIRSFDEYYSNKLEKRYYGICDDYDLLYSDFNSYSDWSHTDVTNYGLPLMKINKNIITKEVALKSALYYSEVTESFFYEGHYYQRGELKYINYTIFDEGDNYIIHIFKTDSIEFDFNECYKLPIFYDIFKISKKDKGLIRLNKGVIEKLFGKCDELPHSNKLRICPDGWIVNLMPGPSCVSKNCINREYFIVNNSRRELEEFDLNWIKMNCKTNIPSPVY
ncbi:hypothetical protein J4427_01515 [Candidatus Woesearchaeota archaeon]|nr:hypothetical protein [Candidatus Woesearchaeota archaeon]